MPQSNSLGITLPDDLLEQEQPAPDPAPPPDAPGNSLGIEIPDSLFDPPPAPAPAPADLDGADRQMRRKGEIHDKLARDNMSDEMGEFVPDALEVMTDNFQVGLNNSLAQVARKWFPTQLSDVNNLLSLEQPYWNRLNKDILLNTDKFLSTMGVDLESLTGDERQRVFAAVGALTMRRALPIRGIARNVAAQSAVQKLLDARVNDPNSDGDKILNLLSKVGTQVGAEYLVSIAYEARDGAFLNPTEKAQLNRAQNTRSLYHPSRKLASTELQLFRDAIGAAPLHEVMNDLEATLGQNWREQLLEQFEGEVALVRDLQIRGAFKDPQTAVLDDQYRITPLNLMPGEFIAQLADKSHALNSDEGYRTLKEHYGTRRELGEALRHQYRPHLSKGFSDYQPMAPLETDANAALRIFDGLWGYDGVFSNLRRLASTVREKASETGLVRDYSRAWASITTGNEQLAAGVNDPFDVAALLMKGSIVNGELSGMLGNVVRRFKALAAANLDMAATFAQHLVPGKELSEKLAEATGIKNPVQYLQAFARRWSDETAERLDLAPNLTTPDALNDLAGLAVNPALAVEFIDMDVKALDVFKQQWNEAGFVDAKDRLMGFIRGERSSVGEAISDAATVLGKTVYLALAEPVYAFIDHPEQAPVYLAENALFYGGFKALGAMKNEVFGRVFAAQSMNRAADELLTLDPFRGRQVLDVARREMDAALAAGAPVKAQKMLETLTAAADTFVQELSLNGGKVAAPVRDRLARALGSTVRKLQLDDLDAFVEVGDILKHTQGVSSILLRQFGRITGLGGLRRISRESIAVASEGLNDRAAKHLTSLVGRQGRVTQRANEVRRVIQETEESLTRPLTPEERLDIMQRVTADHDLIGIHEVAQTAQLIQSAMQGGAFTPLVDQITRRIFGRPSADVMQAYRSINKVVSDVVQAVERSNYLSVHLQQTKDTAAYLYNVARNKLSTRMDGYLIQKRMAEEIGLTDEATQLGGLLEGAQRQLEGIDKEYRRISNASIDSQVQFGPQHGGELWRVLDEEDLAHLMELRPESFGGRFVDEYYKLSSDPPVVPRPEVPSNASPLLRELRRKRDGLVNETAPEAELVKEFTEASRTRRPAGELRPRQAKRQDKKALIDAAPLGPTEKKIFREIANATNFESVVDDYGRAYGALRVLSHDTIEDLLQSTDAAELVTFLPNAGLKEVRRLAKEADMTPHQWMETAVETRTHSAIVGTAIDNVAALAKRVRRHGVSPPITGGDNKAMWRYFASAQNTIMRKTDPQRLGQMFPFIGKVRELDNQIGMVEQMVRKGQDFKHRPIRTYRRNGRAIDFMSYDARGILDDIRSDRTAAQAFSNMRIPAPFIGMEDVPAQYQRWALAQSRRQYIGMAASLSADLNRLAAVYGQLAPKERRLLGAALAEGRAPSELARKFPSIMRPERLDDLLKHDADFQRQLLEMAHDVGLLDDATYGDLISRGYDPHMYSSYELHTLIKHPDARKLKRALEVPGQGPPSIGAAKAPLDDDLLTAQRHLSKVRARIVQVDGRVVNEFFDTQEAAQAWVAREYGQKAAATLQAVDRGMKGRSAIGDRITLLDPIGEEAMEQLGFMKNATAEVRLRRMENFARNIANAYYLQAMERTSGMVVTKEAMERAIAQAAAEGTGDGRHVAIGFIQLPDSREHFGNLSNAYVHERIFAQMNTLQRQYSETKAFLDGIAESFSLNGVSIPDEVTRQLGGRFMTIGSRVNELARSSNITLSHRTWISNIMFNGVLDQIMGSRLFDPKNMDSLLSSLDKVLGSGKSVDPFWDEWISSGLSGVNVFGNQTRNDISKLLRQAIGLDDLEKAKAFTARRRKLLQEKHAASKEGLTPEIRRLELEVFSLDKAIEELGVSNTKKIARELGGLFFRMKDSFGQDVGQLGPALRNAYGDIDEFFRFAMFRNLRKQMGRREALWHIEKFTQNFRDIPPSVQALSSNFLGSFVVGFPWELARIGANIMKYKSMALGRLMAVLPAVSLVQAAGSGVNASRWWDIQKEMGGGNSFRGAAKAMAQFQVWDDKGNIAASVDLDNYFAPGFNFLYGHNNVRTMVDFMIGDEPATTLLGQAVDFGTRAAASMGGAFVLNTPGLNTLGQWLTNKDMRLGRDIVDPKMDAATKFKTHLKKVLHTFLPPAFPYGGRDIANYEEAMEAGIDPDLGRPRGALQPGDALSRMLFGVGTGGRAAQAMEAIVNKFVGEDRKIRSADKTWSQEDTLFHSVYTALELSGAFDNLVTAQESESAMIRNMYWRMLEEEPAERQELKRQFDALIEDRTREVVHMGQLYKVRGDPSKAARLVERLATGGIWAAYADLSIEWKAMAMAGLSRRQGRKDLLEKMARHIQFDPSGVELREFSNPTALEDAISFLTHTAGEDPHGIITETVDWLEKMRLSAEVGSEMERRMRGPRLRVREITNPGSVRVPKSLEEVLGR